MGIAKLDRRDHLGDHLHSGDLSTFEYFTRNVVVSSAIEGAVRSFGLVTSRPIGPENEDVLSLKHLPGLPDLKIFPEAEAASTTKKVEDVVNKIPKEDNQGAGSSNITEGYFAKVSGHLSDLKNRATQIGPVKSCVNYISDNQEWLLVTGSVIGIASIFNYLASKQIRNSYARNVVSLGFGVGATWVVYNYGLGLPLDIMKTADIANRMIFFQYALQLAQPLVYHSIGLAATTVSMAAKPLAYPQKRTKVD